METKVVFLYEKDSKDVWAFFPDQFDNRTGFFTCYSHIGQHSECSHDYFLECNEAQIPDLLPLYDELTSLGYNLRTVPKVDQSWRKSIKAMSQINNLFF